MAAKKLDIFRGVMTFNTIALYKNGTRKRFTGFILIKDEYGNETSYKINSFRSQVIIQSEALGERGMKGMHCTAHGYFKENTWNGETKWELMCDKLYLDGHEQLAADAEAAGAPMPQVPPGTLPRSPNVDPMVAQPVYTPPTGPAPVIQPQAPAPIPGVSLTGPAPIAGGTVLNASNFANSMPALATPTPAMTAPVVPAPVVNAANSIPAPTAPTAPAAVNVQTIPMQTVAPINTQVQELSPVPQVNTEQTPVIINVKKEILEEFPEVDFSKY